MPPPLHYHIVGTAGVGMNAVAQLLLHLGHRVTGSDRFSDQGRQLPILRQLAGLGLELFPQDGSALTPGSRLVFSTAIEADNPERLRAAELGCPELHRATMLAQSLPANAISIAIAGTAGKTTTTGMTGFLLDELGHQPTVINGAALVDWQTEAEPGNVRVSQNEADGDGEADDASPLWVFEADESDRSFLRFHPTHAVITNIAADHFPFEESVQLFRQFAAQVKKSIVCGPGVADLLEGATTATLITPSINEIELAIPGEHNRENARHALALSAAAVEDLNPEKARHALARFRGIERRLEEIQTTKAFRIFDDYGHNPGKIAAALRAVSEAVEGNVLAVWRPHGFGPLANNLDAFAETFRQGLCPQDQGFLLPVFYAGGTTSFSVTSEDLAKKVDRLDVVETYEALLPKLIDQAQPGDAVVFMGARDPDLPIKARELAAM